MRRLVPLYLVLLAPAAILSAADHEGATSADITLRLERPVVLARR